MKDKLLTLGGFDRAKAWIEAALQLLQGKIPEKVSDLTNDARFVTADDANVNIPALSGRYRQMLSTNGSALQWMSLDTNPVEAGGWSWYVYEQSSGIYYFPSQTITDTYFGGSDAQLIHHTLLRGGIMVLGNDKFFTYLGFCGDNNYSKPVVIHGIANSTNGGATIVEIDSAGGGLTNFDFTHISNTTVSTSTTTVTFAADQRGSAMLTISADLGLTIACNNGSDNYIWVKNTGSAEVDVTISAVTKNSTAVSNVYVPSDGITVPAGGLCEIGVIVNADGAFITSRNDLAL